MTWRKFYFHFQTSCYVWQRHTAKCCAWLFFKWESWGINQHTFLWRWNCSWQDWFLSHSFFKDIIYLHIFKSNFLLINTVKISHWEHQIFLKIITDKTLPEMRVQVLPEATLFPVFLLFILVVNTVGQYHLYDKIQ